MAFACAVVAFQINRVIFFVVANGIAKLKNGGGRKRALALQTLALALTPRRITLFHSAASHRPHKHFYD